MVELLSRYSNRTDLLEPLLTVLRRIKETTRLTSRGLMLTLRHCQAAVFKID